MEKIAARNFFMAKIAEKAKMALREGNSCPVKRQKALAT
jgi:hypothetical protein